jgi:hypothetical protein
MARLVGPERHTIVFVLTHHWHDPIDMEGGTTFYSSTASRTAARLQADDRPTHRWWGKRSPPSVASALPE